MFSTVDYTLHTYTYEVRRSRSRQQSVKGVGNGLARRFNFAD